MNLIFLIFFFILGFVEPNVPPGAQKLINSYPEHIAEYKDNKIFFKDGSSLVYNDGLKKSASELINNPDLEDQFLYIYPTGNYDANNLSDAGRIRNEEFFKKMYGDTQAKVRSNLVSIVWCPKTVGQTIQVTKVNGINEKLKQISAELDQMPEFKEYLRNVGGTFVWRNIKGTNRLSMHSFGCTIDINTKYSDYWQWSCGCTDENTPITKFKNRIPQKIVDIFEKHGFIWGGRWKHFDTMHFEYRPELL